MTGSETIRLRGAGGLTLVGEVHGEGGAPPVVLFHGGGQTRRAWRRTCTRLAAAGWRAVAVDLRGHGDTGWTDRYGLSWFVDDVAAVVEQLDTPVLVGASLGGIASLLAVGETAVGARGLVLVDVAHRLESAGVERIRGFMLAKPEGYGSVEEVADAVARYLPHRRRPTVLEGLRRNLRQGTDGRWRWHWDPAFLEGLRTSAPGQWRARSEAAAGRVQVPTLVVRGRASDVVSPEAAQELTGWIAGAELVDVAGARHMVAGDKNDPFTEAVVGFLARLR